MEEVIQALEMAIFIAKCVVLSCVIAIAQIVRVVRKQ